MSPAVLFDGSFVQVLHWARASSFSLITFDIMHARANGRGSFARVLSARLGLDHLAVVPKSPCWYPAEDMMAVSELLRALVDRPAIAYGASMGGYGALKWGASAGATVALACSPQSTIDPEQLGRADRRYARFFDSRLHEGMAVTGRDLPEKSVVLFDPHFGRDRTHAEMLASHDRIEAIALPHMAHGTARCVAGSSNALAIFTSLLDGDTASIRSRVLATRKFQAVYYLELAVRALRRKKYGLCVQLAERARPRDPVGYHMLMARHDASRGDQCGAAAHYRAALELKPWHKIARNRLEQIEGTAI